MAKGTSKKVTVEQSAYQRALEKEKGLPSKASTGIGPQFLFLGVVVVGLAIFGATAWQPQESNNNAAADTASSAVKEEKDENTVHLQDLLEDVDAEDYWEYNHFLEYHDFRTIAKANLGENEKIVDVNRFTQMWDVDAFANPMVQSLFAARHNVSYQPIDHRAFLAVHLMLMKKGHVKIDNIQKLFLDLMPPSWEHELETSHPMFRTRDDLLTTMGGNHSLAFILASQGREKYISEYKAMVKESPELEKLITKNEYLLARLYVLTRSFNTGPLSAESLAKSTRHLPSFDIDKVKSQLLLWDCEKVGCTAMVPIIDRLNHHANPNTKIGINRDTLDFTLASREATPAGNELFLTLGDQMDSWLYATHGFVSGDGSGRTGVSLAAFHSPFDASSLVPYRGSPKSNDFRTKQLHELVRYMQYDDGYRECVTPIQENANGLQLKGLKLRLLELIANNMDKWTFAVDARNPTAPAPKSIREMPELYVPTFDSDIASRLDKKEEFSTLNFILSTCRILALTHKDYDGKAINMLYDFVNRISKNPNESSKMNMEPGDDGLEYRARYWLLRLAKIMLRKYSKTTQQLTTRITRLHKKNEIGTVEWNEAQVMLGEIQTLELLISYAEDYLVKHKKTDDDSFFVRKLVCPVEYSMPIVPNFTATARATQA